MAANQGALLSDLCGICHTTIPKYKCPRCSARTCSLPCYKRHQQRAECSGKRDATKYVKRSDLSSASGIDHDYNFITGIEKALDRKDDEAEDRKQARDGGGRVIRDIPQYHARLKKTGVLVEKAPAGMSRSRQNRTRWGGRKGQKSIIWTTEWINEAGERFLFDEAQDNLSMHDLYSMLLTRVLQDQTNEPKRKRQKTSPWLSGVDEQQTQEQQHTLNEQGVKRYLYLVRPRSNSETTVLIPLSDDQSLFDCLKQRTVLEFPTIQILTQAPDALPPRYLLESEYLSQLSKEQAELDELLAKSQSHGLPTADKSDHITINEDDWTEQRIMHSLMKDAMKSR